jgi:transposase
MATHPGVYVIRTNDTTMSAEKMWKTYIMLTDVEAVFRSLKSELGLRPVFHRKSLRTRGHLFISVLAYQCVQLIRRELKSQGLTSNWTTLRTRFSQHSRVTCSFRQAAGTTLHIGKAVQAPAEVLAIYHGLGITTRPGATRKYEN